MNGEAQVSIPSPIRGPLNAQDGTLAAGATFFMPKRIQLSRKKGWRLPPNTINVARPSKWGNPFRVEEYGRWGAVDRFRVFMTLRPAVRGKMLNVEELRGKNLACWCGPDQLCHADVLLELANP